MFNGQLQPLMVDDFSGGKNDNYLHPDGTNQYKRANNFLIDDERKLALRPGSEVEDVNHTVPGFLGSNPRTCGIFEFQAQKFEISGKRIFYNHGTYSELFGPVSSNPALGTGTTANRPAWAFWNNHAFVTLDSFATPRKIYKDGSGNFQVRTAGLPKLAADPVVTGSIAAVLAFANDVKSKYNTHLASGAAHTAGADGTNLVTAANATNLSTLITLVTQMLTKYTAHEADAKLSASWAFHAGMESMDHSLSVITPPIDIQDCVSRLLDLKQKINDHMNDLSAHGVATTNITLADVAVHSYAYAFLYYYTYTVGDSTFEDFGSTRVVLVEDVDSPDITPIAISALSVLANGSTEAYDTANIKVKIYRTIDSGLSFYYAGQVTNGTTTYSDTSSDATIQGNGILLYTDGGVLDNDTPPLSKYIVIVNGVGFYLNTKEGGVSFPNRVRQSVPADIDSCPGSLFVDLEDEIVGGGSVGQYPIIFCKNRIYRLEGIFDEFGGGIIDPKEISRTVGCLGHLSIVYTRDGLFFAGIDGFYFTNGYDVQKISDNINTSFRSLINVSDSTKNSNIYGSYENVRNRIWWGVQMDSSNLDNDSCYVLHIKYGISPKMPFTTLDGGLSFAPTALLFALKDKKMYRGDKRGYLLQHDDDFLTDPKINTTTSPSTWIRQVIMYDYISAGFSFGDVSIRKWVPKLILYAKNIANVSIGIFSINDDSTQEHPLKEVKILTNIIWGDSTITWGDPDIVWNYNQLVSAERRFPSVGGLRCSYKQVQFTNSFTNIENSDSLGTADVDSAAKTVLLLTAPTNIWPTDAIDYFISFESDDYATNYLITDRTDDTLTYADPDGATITAPGSKWLIRGYKKGDTLSILNYSLMYGFTSDTQSKFQGVQGGNA